MKGERQRRIREIIRRHPVATQQELVERLTAYGIAATQSSVSRDIVEMRLTKMDGCYVAPQEAQGFLPAVELRTAGDNLLVLKTQVGQAQPVALAIDNAAIQTVVGTLAGDDTVFIAVADAAAQKAARRAIKKLFGLSGSRAKR